jgi:hypothetical protein
MTVQASQKDFLTFLGGLNTEGGFFTQPQNTWREGRNVIPDIDGSLSRRKGIDFENGYSEFEGVNSEGLAQTISTWESVHGNGDVDFFVVQLGLRVYFFSAFVGSTSNQAITVSSGAYLNLTPYLVGGSAYVPGSAMISVASTDGRCVITSRDTFPIILEANTDNTDVSVLTEYDLTIRDFEGVDDGLDVEDQPATLSDTHNYNLLNQGWRRDLVNAYFAEFGRYPSNAQSWIYGKNSNGFFEAERMTAINFGTSQAPKGKFIINPFNPNRNGFPQISGITGEVVVNYRPKFCAFFAGRVWYAGVEGLGQNRVYFSKVVESIDDYGKCYSQNDPTSEILNELIDSDGGVIKIQDVGEITGLRPFLNGMLVLSSAGVWHITGGDSGFKASSYIVNKITNQGCFSAKSIVEAEGFLYYWSNSSILQLGGSAFEPQVRSITDLNIKTFYTDINNLSKRSVQGAYNPDDKVIWWLYYDDTADYWREGKDSILIFDVRLGAFYNHRIAAGSGGCTPIALAVTKSYGLEEQTFDMVIEGDPVEIAAEQVVITLDVPDNGVAVFKVLCNTDSPASGNVSYTFADFDNTRTGANKFADWYTANSVGNYTNPYIITGYDVAQGSPGSFFGATYLHAYMKRTEASIDVSGNPVNESSVLLQHRWDFTGSTVAGKWGGPYEIYRHVRNYIPSVPETSYDDGYPLVITKNKIRGRGRALQLKWEGADEKDFQLVGWSVTYVKNVV